MELSLEDVAQILGQKELELIILRSKLAQYEEENKPRPTSPPPQEESK